MSFLEEISVFKSPDLSNHALKVATILQTMCWQDPNTIPDTLTHLQWTITFLTAAQSTAEQDDQLKLKLKGGEWTPYEIAYFALRRIGKAKTRTKSDRGTHQSVCFGYQTQIQTLHAELSSQSPVTLTRPVREEMALFFTQVAKIAKEESEA